MKAPSALKLVAAILLAGGAFALNTPGAYASNPSASGHFASEDSNPSPSPTEPSEATKQAAENAREAAKQSGEKNRETNKNNKKADSKVGSGQVQLPPLVIRPATPGDKISSDSGSSNDQSNDAGSGDSNASDGSGLSGGSGSAVSPSTGSSTDPSSVTNGAGTGGKKFYVAPKPAASSGSTQNSTTTVSGQGAAADGSDSASTADDGQVTYVVSPLQQASGSQKAGDSEYVKLADPTANEPIQVVSAAGLKTPADQFFEMAGFGILGLGIGAASLISIGVYRGVRARRSSSFDFEYRS